MAVKIAFVTYETPFAPGGGIAAVVGRLPAMVRRAAGVETVVVTPFHRRMKRTAELSVADRGQVAVGPRRLPVSVKLHQDGAGLPWYFLRPANDGYFAGYPHPYRVGETPEENARLLRRDSLVFGAATVEALRAIDPAAEWVLLLQDWEAATAALALSGHRAFLTLHNSYDSGLVTAEELAAAGLRPVGGKGETVLQRAIPLVEPPIFTVSEQFASDLLEDPLQAQIMAPHLQKLLRGRLVGVDNGPFATLSVEAGLLSSARRGDAQPLAQWKLENRRRALEALDALAPSAEAPVWGDRGRFDRAEAACWFLMAGRDDPRQKGYDVAAAAVEAFFARGGDARFIFFAIPGDEGLAGLGFLKALAERFPERVLALPFVWREGFLATLRGASYGLMPSLYEPFGMANEFYLMGAVAIGRATGGIIQQIVPLVGAASFSRAAAARARRWHPPAAEPTGILWRERDDIASAIGDLRGLNDAAYSLSDPTRGRTAHRKQFAIFRAMADELRVSIEDGVRLYRDSPALYGQMLARGIDHIRCTFSWERAAQEYVRHLALG